MARGKKITFVNYISVNGAEPVLWNSLPEEKKLEYGQALNHKMLTAMGYVPVTENGPTAQG